MICKWKCDKGGKNEKIRLQEDGHTFPFSRLLAQGEFVENEQKNLCKKRTEKVEQRSKGTELKAIINGKDVTTWVTHG